MQDWRIGRLMIIALLSSLGLEVNLNTLIQCRMWVSIKVWIEQVGDFRLFVVEFDDGELSRFWK